MKIWDVSRTLSNDLAEWPGDEPCRFRLTREKTKGESVNLGAISMSVHNGTHADAQFHFDTNGGSIEKVSLETYLGRAAVVDLTQAFLESKEKRLITIEDLRPAAESIAPLQSFSHPLFPGLGFGAFLNLPQLLASLRRHRVPSTLARPRHLCPRFP